MKTLIATLIAAAALVGTHASAYDYEFTLSEMVVPIIEVSPTEGALNVLVNVDTARVLDEVSVSQCAGLTLDFQGDYGLTCELIIKAPCQGITNITTSVPDVAALWKESFSVEGGGSKTLCTAGMQVIGDHGTLQLFGKDAGSTVLLNGTEVVYKGAVNGLEILQQNEVGIVWNKNSIQLVGKIAYDRVYTLSKMDSSSIDVLPDEGALNVLVNVDDLRKLTHISVYDCAGLTLDFQKDYVLTCESDIHAPHDGITNITTSAPDVEALWKESFSVEGGGSKTLCTAGMVGNEHGPLQLFGAEAGSTVSLDGTEVVYRGVVKGLELLQQNEVGIVWGKNSIQLVGKIGAEPDYDRVYTLSKMDSSSIDVLPDEGALNVLVNVDTTRDLSSISVSDCAGLTLDFQGDYVLTCKFFIDAPHEGIINITTSAPDVEALWKESFSVEGGGSKTLCSAGLQVIGIHEPLQLFGAEAGSTVLLDGTEVVYRGAVDGLEILQQNEVGIVWNKNSIQLVGKIGAEPGPTPPVPEPATGTLSLLALAGLCARRRRK